MLGCVYGKARVQYRVWSIEVVHYTPAPTPLHLYLAYIAHCTTYNPNWDETKRDTGQEDYYYLNLVCFVSYNED